MRKNLILSFSILLVVIFLNSCCSSFGSYDLGDNFTMLSGDGDKQEIIIYCSPNREEKCCNGGPQIIPTLDDYYSGDYVEDVEFDNRWIIILVVNKINNNRSYWIIDKDFKLEDSHKNWPMSQGDTESFNKLIQSHIYGSFDLEGFINKKQELGIKLSF